MWRSVTFITSTGPKDLMVTLAWALGLRQSASMAALERTILKEVLSTAKAAAANKAPISSAAPTASNARLNLLFLLTFFSSLSSPQVCWAFLLVRRCARPCAPPPPAHFGLVYSNRRAIYRMKVLAAPINELVLVNSMLNATRTSENSVKAKFTTAWNPASPHPDRARDAEERMLLS